MPENLLPALLIGSMTFAVGLVLLRRATYEAEPQELPGRPSAAMQRQRWRRQQIAGLVMLLGSALPVGVAAQPLQKGLPAICFWTGVLLLTGWVVLLGLGDFAVSALRTRQQLLQLRARHAALRDELEHHSKVNRPGTSDSAQSAPDTIPSK